MEDSANFSESSLRLEILRLVGEYSKIVHQPSSFVPGDSPVPVSGKVFDHNDVCALADSALDFWLTAGRFAEQFEFEFANRMGTKHSLLCNSGSSANLLAFSTLTSPKLGDRRICPGDEVITAAVGFPTTVNPIIQAGAVPVFIDVDLATYDVNPSQVEAAIGPRTRAIFIAHTLGNPFDLELIGNIASRHDLWLIEDTCDAVGAKFRGRGVGTVGDLATTSFYPAHHITMGEGGAVLTQKTTLKRIAESFRDWGRDCWCAPGQDNTCGKRFSWQLGDMPQGYDHKYIYSHVGYNLKATDMQAAVGLSQLQKLDEFVAARNKNWAHLRSAFREMEHFFVLPEATEGAEPSWFGFAVTIREGVPFSRRELITFLDSRRIGTRQLFGGNLLRQPAYRGLECRVVGSLVNSNLITENSFWLGVYPGLTTEMLDYVVASVEEFVRPF